ncbi:MAG: winged helix-turn-helix transcriptional regulator [Nitrospiraceae bacterium]|nr:MAG: winged helix-turn-helix transcriptional regulator [Nitrospiraceae bacterium]
MDVHKMNKERQEKQNIYKSLLLLDEISKGGPLSQRALSKKLNIALGLVNSYLKNLVAKGYVTVKAIPAKRYVYYLTPKGLGEKSRLTYHLLQDYTRIYREARANLRKLFREMSDSGIKKVVFAGADEVSEIAYLTLKETDIELAGVIDAEKAGQRFLGMDVKTVSDIDATSYDCIVVTSYLKREEILKYLLSNGIPKKDIKLIFQ